MRIALAPVLGLAAIVSSPLAPAAALHDEQVVVCNRASGDLSVIRVRDDAVVHTIALPPGDHPPEPMYANASRRHGLVLVGDRANDRVVAFDRHDYSVVGEVSAGDGVFHQWVDARGRLLWVNNDVDATATLVRIRDLHVLGTIPMPPDLVARGGKPHDVVLDPGGHSAYVTMVGFPGETDIVVKFDTRRMVEDTRAEVGKDPHVSLTHRNRLLYVPTQNANEVRILDRHDLSFHSSLDVPGAHGAGMMKRGRYLYTTNLPGAGVMALYTIDTRRNELVGDPVDAPPLGVPHNLTTAQRDRKLYCTHSGATADSVSVYRIGHRHPVPELIGEITVGRNPFGLTAVR